MMKRVKVIRDHPPGDVGFKDENNDMYAIDWGNFLYWRNGRQYWKNKNEQEFVKELKKYQQWLFVEINNQNRVTTMLPIQIPEYLIPSIYQNRVFTFDNYALAVEKYGRFHKDKLEYMHQNRKELFYTPNFNKEPYQSLVPQIAQEKVVAMQAVGADIFTLKAQSGFLLGLGNASAYNNGFTFHPVWGFPYINGEAIKGSLRNYILNECFVTEVDRKTYINFLEQSKDPQKKKEMEKMKKMREKLEVLAMNDQVFRSLFGADHLSDKGEQAGAIHFFDALPTNSNFTIKPEIINPHYGKYYSDEKNKTAPHDALSPVPIVFLKVVGAEFICGYKIQKNGLQKIDVEVSKLCISMENEEQPKDVDGMLVYWLKKMLEEQGIGAKTKVGFGEFKKEI